MTFFVRGKRTSCSLTDDHHGDGRLAVVCSAVTGAQQELIESDPERFFRPPYVGHRGEVFALLGPNGAGTTTTAEILEGHRRRTSGCVSVLGLDPSTDGRELRERRIVAAGSPDALMAPGQTGTTIPFHAPDGVGVDELPEPVRADALLAERTVVVSTTEPTTVLHALTSWALAGDRELEGLTVTRPNLEDPPRWPTWWRPCSRSSTSSTRSATRSIRSRPTWRCAGGTSGLGRLGRHRRRGGAAHLPVASPRVANGYARRADGPGRSPRRRADVRDEQVTHPRSRGGGPRSGGVVLRYVRGRSHRVPHESQPTRCRVVSVTAARSVKPERPW